MLRCLARAELSSTWPPPPPLPVEPSPLNSEANPRRCRVGWLAGCCCCCCSWRASPSRSSAVQARTVFLRVR